LNFAQEIEQLEVFQNLRRVVAEAKVEAYVIGGYVRDLLLKRPCKDIDVVCIGSGTDLAEQFAAIYGESADLAVYKNFGTAMVKIPGWEVEFVGARKESYRSDSRKPIVEDGTLEDDQNRRDFTINALAIGLNDKNWGTLLDPFGGLKHLEEKILRTPLNPDITFSDDPLRMMRAIRFASQLTFDIEPDTFESIIRNKERIGIVSQERIIEEVNKIVLCKKPSYGFNLLFHSGLLPMIFPEMAALQGAEEKDGKGHKDNFYHTLKVLDNVCQTSEDLWLRWAAIMHDIAKPPTKRFDPKHGWTFHGHEELGARMTPKIFARLKLPMNEKMRFVQKLVRLHLRPIALAKDGVTDTAIRRLLFEAGEDVEALMKLCRADITSKNNDKKQRYLANFDKVEKLMQQVEESDQLRNFQPAFSGNDIMELFQLAPGPQVGQLKFALREAILEGQIKNTVDESLDFILQMGEKMGLKKAA
jgi:poly(A) polymerase